MVIPPGLHAPMLRCLSILPTLSASFSSRLAFPEGANNKKKNEEVRVEGDRQCFCVGYFAPHASFTTDCLPVATRSRHTFGARCATGGTKFCRRLGFVPTPSGAKVPSLDAIPSTLYMLENGTVER
jgi:hypothetical protein